MKAGAASAAAARAMGVPAEGLALHAPQWYRVGGLHWRLRPGLHSARQVVRGTVWHVVTDPYTGRQHRFNDPAWRWLSALDGTSTLDEIWRAQLAQHGDDALTQPEAMQVLSHAYTAQLLSGTSPGDARALALNQREALQKRRRSAINPLAFRLPLWNPDAALARWAPRLSWLLTPAARTLGWLVALIGLLGVLWQGPALAREAWSAESSFALLLAMWLAWPIMKALHELAHGLTIKHMGGEVHEMGITLMLLMPMPYVDASASAAFADKRERAAVAAAGIWVEALLTALALGLWSLLEPGLLRQICLGVVLVGGLSTLLVNGNPLMRYDGYHVMADLLELPNLATRSARWWQLFLQRHLLRERHAVMRDLAPGERGWLVMYAPLSWLWRVGVMVVLAWGLGQISPVLAVLLLGLCAWMAVLGPLWKTLRWVWKAPEAAGMRGRAALALSAGAGVLVYGMLGVPLADRSHAPGIVWLPEEAFVRLHSDARLEAFLVQDGQRVVAGQAVALLRNEDLQAELAKAEQVLSAAQVERLMRFGQDGPGLAVADDQLTRLRAEAERLRQQIDALVLRAAVDGTVVLQKPDRLQGRWLAQGDLLAQVLPDSGLRVRALVRNADVARLQSASLKTEVQLADRAEVSLPVTWERSVPQASRTLPSAALGRPAGGPLPTDPADSSGLTATEARFAIDLRLPPGAQARVGTRAWVRFEHGEAVAASVLWRWTRQNFLRHLPA